ncbi:SRPBCC family protein [Spirosoma utsteinense]|uniref:Activator of Hsp90 ATPase homologue 1/2-like C-terminal domain-containing protein n=1 Tax=Spirosoma utsteinense TaxID=2585773 RepID=A0ABR6WFF2_9BACT|nr:SRPBCC domain-containing protein [Spirosoma utsteinense]MBC3789418.1 putative protein YndB with AHSA1/START domain [Spirosoma utsteinense]MBC3795262.1 putative protein YndB with AHSA1/START domain [Spirosoma utsteinense]
MTTPLVIERTFATPIERMWRALTEKDALREWYFSQLQQFEPTVGFEFRFTNDGSAYQKDWKVTEVIAGQKLAHTWAYKGYPGRSEVAFELFDDGDKTILRVTHTGLESFPQDAHFARQRFEWGWRFIGDNLANFLAK